MEVHLYRFVLAIIRYIFILTFGVNITCTGTICAFFPNNHYSGTSISEGAWDGNFRVSPHSPVIICAKKACYYKKNLPLNSTNYKKTVCLMALLIKNTQ